MTNLVISIFLGLGLMNLASYDKHIMRDDLSCTLQFVGIECIQQEGTYFNDAIYFKINGDRWPSNRNITMGSGDYADLEGYVNIRFSNTISIELWDDDSYDPDDFLGKKIITCSYESNGVVRFTEDGANYKLYYRVN